MKLLSNYSILIYICLKRFTLHKFLCPHIEDKRAIWCAEHRLDFVDTDTAVFSSFILGHCEFSVNGKRFDFRKCSPPFLKVQFQNLSCQKWVIHVLCRVIFVEYANIGILDDFMDSAQQSRKGGRIVVLFVHILLTQIKV